MDENQKPEPYFPSATAMEQLREREAMDRAAIEEATPVPEVVQADVRARTSRRSSGKSGDVEALSRIRAVLETMRDQDADFYKASQEHAIRQEEIAERALENARESPTRVDEDGAPAGKKSIWDRIFSFVESIFSIFTKGFMAFVGPWLIPIGKALLAIGVLFALAYNAFKDVDFGKVLGPLKKALIFLWDAVKVLADVIWSGTVMVFKILDGVLTQFVNLVKWALTPVVEYLAEILGPVGAGLNDFWQNSVKPAATAFSEMLRSVGDFFDWFKTAKPEQLKDYFIGVLRSIPDAFQRMLAESSLGKMLGIEAPQNPVAPPPNPAAEITAARHEAAVQAALGNAPKATGDIPLSLNAPVASHTPSIVSRLPAELRRPGRSSESGSVSRVPSAPFSAPAPPTPAAPPTSSRVTSPTGMSLSPEVMESLIQKEGFRPAAYQDDGKQKKWTIGLGSTYWQGKPVSATWPGREITFDEAYAEASRQLSNDYEKKVQRRLKRPVTQGQYDSLVHVMYNVSTNTGNRLIDKWNDNGTLTEEDFTTLTTPNEETRRGIMNRRRHEYAMFTGTTASALRPTPTSVSSSTTAIRAAGPVQTASTQLSAASGSPTIVVAPSVVNQSSPNQSTRNIPYPVPIITRDTSLAALMTVNAM